MGKKPNALKTTIELTAQQRKFVDVLVANWGQIKKVDAAEQAGYKSKNGKPYEIASRLLNPDLNPHVCRYLEKKLQKETEKYEKDKLRRFKTFERLRNGAEVKGQYTGAINAEFRSGQMAGMFVDKKEITHMFIFLPRYPRLSQTKLPKKRNFSSIKNCILFLPFNMLHSFA